MTTHICYILVTKWWKYPEYCEMLVRFEGYKISDCYTQKNPPVELRIDIVKLNKLCFNCLSNSHFIN